jgi:hypothetical protein
MKNLAAENHFIDDQANIIRQLRDETTVNLIVGALF